MRVRPSLRDERGALTTEMMILTAVLCIVAGAALVILRGAMTDAADQINVNVDSGTAPAAGS